MEVLLVNLSLEFVLVMKIPKSYPCNMAATGISPVSFALLARFIVSIQLNLFSRLLLFLCARGIHALKMNAAQPFGRSQIIHNIVSNFKSRIK
jgi:hypothetical protein